MSDQNFHEIQLSGKQLVFLFMCAVVLTVVVFLFGVSVGRQVRSAVTPATPAAVPDTPIDAAPAVPAAGKPAPDELSYADALEGKGVEDPSKAPPPPPAPEQPSPTETQTDRGQAPKAAEPQPAKAAPTPDKAAAKPASPLGGWVVQVGAFNANDVASREVAKLQGKGYPAFVFSEAETVPGPRYKVRVGPYSARTEADRILRELTREGYRPLVRPQ